MIQLIDISVNFGTQTVFDRCSLSLPPGKHFGLVGQNGSGKSTLLKIIAGLSEANEGQVVVPKNNKVAYLQQEIKYENTGTKLLEEVLTVFEHIFNLEKEMRSLEMRISEESTPELLQAYDQLQERFHSMNGYATESRAKEILTGLGFKESDFQRPVSEFSGGWHMRIALAKILLQEPDCLMLDEPTNHLDMETLVWLENLLSAYKGTLIMVSHDRYFLDKIINAVIEVENGKIVQYSGNYTDYEVQKEARFEHDLAVMRNQQRKVSHMEQFVERFRYKASKAKQVQSRVKQLSKIKVKEVNTGSSASMKLTFNKPERSGDPVVAAHQLSFAYETDPIFTDSNFEIRRGEKAALVGPNGVGKSTLMKLITGDLKGNEGKLSLGYNLQIGYFAQHHLEQLNAKNTVLDEIWNSAPFMPKNEVRSLLGRFLFSGDDVDKPVGVLSGGEKSRMALIKLLLSKANFLILDEPTNHLDMQSKEILASALDDFEGSVWHSASWNHDVDLAGQNVAIIGTGASTIQFLPTVVSQAERVYLFQRSPCWIHPFQNRRYSSLTKWCFRNLPFVARLYRLWLFLLCESRIVGFRKEGLVNHIYRWWLTRHMRSAIAPELHERLIPEYDPGCKRILLANDYLQTVQKPNVTLMTDSIQKLHVHEIETANDRYRVDVVIYGTGFQTTTLLQPMKITGRGGVELTEAWKDRPKTLFGLATPSFPNMFMLYGPNTNLGHNSIIYMVEAQVDYVMKCLAEADRRHSHEIEVAEDAVAEFDLQIHGDLQQSIWAGDCSSWYKTNDGTIPNNWSGAASTYRRRTRHPNFNAWKFSPIVETTTAWKLSEDSDS